jgi:pre-mRNA-splicing factor ATP-dependent RNA helicase DHX15/PRP43
VVQLHPSCALKTQPEWVLFNEFVLTTRHFIRTVTEIRPEWLLELAANYYDLQTFTNGDTKRSLQRVLKKRRERTGKKADLDAATPKNRRRTSKKAELDAATLKMNSMKLS